MVFAPNDASKIVQLHCPCWAGTLKERSAGLVLSPRWLRFAACCAFRPTAAATEAQRVATRCQLDGCSLAAQGSASTGECVWLAPGAGNQVRAHGRPAELRLDVSGPDAIRARELCRALHPTETARGLSKGWSIKDSLGRNRELRPQLVVLGMARASGQALQGPFRALAAAGAAPAKLAEIPDGALASQRLYALTGQAALDQEELPPSEFRDTDRVPAHPGHAQRCVFRPLAPRRHSISGRQ